MKKFNLAALPLAVAGVLASTSAFAGTEACFEVYKVAAAGLVTNHSDLYSPASCEATRAGASTTTLEAVVNPTVAWELTGDVDLNLEVLGTIPRTHIVYIPTTDIPPASRIKMQLTGADFGTANANQIYLVHDDGTNFQTVASSDGVFNDGVDIEFLTKAGVTIGAGSRLLLSTNNPDGTVLNTVGADIPGINLHINNSETCTIDPVVSIRATSALTDSGTTIAGGRSSTADITVSGGSTSVVSIPEQFNLLAVLPLTPNATRDIQVDAEDPSFRKSFVNNGMADLAGTPTWSNQVIAQKAFWEAKFTNSFDTLDMFVTLDADDTVSFDLSTDSGTGDGVTFGILADITNPVDLSVLDAEAVSHIEAVNVADILLVDITGSTTEELALTETPVNHSALATEYFQESAGVVAVTNAATTLTNDVTEVMEFNYDVTTTWSMNFNEVALLNKNACKPPVPYSVGVNGAVLKVPYAYTKTGNGGFVRITSEHTTEATIFMDIFDESSNEYKNVNLGQIAPKSSNVLLADGLLQSAIDAGYTGTGDRHTMTFTVTAPKNKVHGVSVQKIAGGVDRVMPVLDQNDWSQ